MSSLHAVEISTRHYLGDPHAKPRLAPHLFILKILFSLFIKSQRSQ